MNKTASEPLSNMELQSRPSLYFDDESMYGSTRAPGILAALEPARAKKTWLSWGVVTSMLVMLCSIGIYWTGMHSSVPEMKALSAWMNRAWQGQSVPGETSKSVSPAVSVAAVSLTDKPQVSGMAIADAGTGPVAVLPAAPTATNAINTVPATSSVSAQPQQEKGMPSSTKAASTAVIPLQSLSVANCSLASKKKDSAKAKAPRKKADQFAPNSTAAKTTAAKTTAAKKTVTRASKEKDQDVELIAALLAHSERDNRALTNGRHHQSKSPSEMRSESRNTSIETNSIKRDKPADATRDVITRASGDSIESLVKRCRALGLIEGELCRVRICSGQWGRNPACPANMAAQH